jgi:hypothetical protein
VNEGSLNFLRQMAATVPCVFGAVIALQRMQAGKLSRRVGWLIVALMLIASIGIRLLL